MLGQAPHRHPSLSHPLPPLSCALPRHLGASSSTPPAAGIIFLLAMCQLRSTHPLDLYSVVGQIAVCFLHIPPPPPKPPPVFKYEHYRTVTELSKSQRCRPGHISGSQSPTPGRVNATCYSRTVQYSTMHRAIYQIRPNPTFPRPHPARHRWVLLKKEKGSRRSARRIIDRRPYQQYYILIRLIVTVSFLCSRTVINHPHLKGIGHL